MKVTVSIAAALAAAPLVAAAPANVAERNLPQPTPGLNDLARKAGLLYFGTAIDNPNLSNKEYTDIAYNEHNFGQVTPANGQKVRIPPSAFVFWELKSHEANNADGF